VPASEREWAREPLPAERIGPTQPKIWDEADGDVELVQTADGYRVERVEPVHFGCGAVVFWFFLILITRWVAQ